MNLGIYRSWHAAIAVGLVGGCFSWHLAAPMPFGDRDDANVAYLLTTGWLAVGFYVVLALYAVRRAAHRLRLTPEFGWKVPLPALERAQVQLTELQNRIDRREITGKKPVLAEAKAIARRHGVHKVLRFELRPNPKGLGLVQLDVRPREALGRLAAWLHAHVYYGVAAAFVVWFHGGGRCGSTMGLLLNVLSYFVIGSGLFGALMWTFGPGWLTRAERELSIEKATALVLHLDEKLAAADAAATAAEGDDKQRLEQEAATLRGQRRLVAREAARLERFRFLLRGWRLVHVPVSIVLLALVVVHVVGIWYY